MTTVFTATRSGIVCTDARIARAAAEVEAKTVSLPLPPYGSTPPSTPALPARPASEARA